MIVSSSNCKTSLKSQMNQEKVLLLSLAMGVTNDVAEYFKRSFKKGLIIKWSIIERILTPRCALTAAEYLTFKQNMHVLVIYSDVTSYCEALREFSHQLNEFHLI